jgi:hypothetical protein
MKDLYNEIYKSLKKKLKKTLEGGKTLHIQLHYYYEID